MYTGVHLGTRHSCEILIKPEFFRQMLENYPNIKFHENPYSGIAADLCSGQTERRTRRN
jgi:hypothetical protein